MRLTDEGYIDDGDDVSASVAVDQLPLEAREGML